MPKVPAGSGGGIPPHERNDHAAIIIPAFPTHQCSLAQCSDHTEERVCRHRVLSRTLSQCVRQQTAARSGTVSVVVTVDGKTASTTNNITEGRPGAATDYRCCCVSIVVCVCVCVCVRGRGGYVYPSLVLTTAAPVAQSERRGFTSVGATLTD